MPFGRCIENNEIEEDADKNLMALKPENFLFQVGAKVDVLCAKLCLFNDYA